MTYCQFCGQRTRSKRLVCRDCVNSDRDITPGGRKMDAHELHLKATHCTDCGDRLYRGECQRCKEEHLDRIVGPATKLMCGD